MQGNTIEDKRVFERFSAACPVTFLNLDSQTEHQGQLYDVSAKGLGLVTSAEFFPSAPLEMWVKVPDSGEPFYTRGEVKWSREVEPNKYRIGVSLERADFMGLSRVIRNA